MTTDAENKNIEIVKQVLRDALANDVDGIKAKLADDIEVRIPKNMPYGGREYRGWSGYVDACNALVGTWKDIHLEDQEYFAKGDKVIVLSHMTARLGKGNHLYDQPAAELWVFKDGKISWIMPFYYDTKLIMDLDAQ
jgi:ketosteroid isomerase-like protein